MARHASHFVLSIQRSLWDGGIGCILIVTSRFQQGFPHGFSSERGAVGRVP